LRAIHSAKLDPPIVCLERFHLLGPMVEQTMLQVDPGERGGQRVQIPRWRTNKAAELAKTPVCWHHRVRPPGHNQREMLRIAAARLDAHGPALDSADQRAIGTGTDGGIKIGQGQIPLVTGPGKSFGRNPANPLAG